MTDALAHWNCLSVDQAREEILPCCGSMAWAQEMTTRRPFPDKTALLAASDEIWRSLTEADWMEAFLSHPRIGEWRAAQEISVQSSAWSTQEQQTVTAAGDAVKIALAEANRAYEHHFGHIFIVSASGKSGAEILEILQRRLQNDKKTELREASEQQRQITHIRLRKWLSE
jgi:2-oxo-4-hydroxy-4-carboxy-5-ureidoimidazoline decarboxylase